MKHHQNNRANTFVINRINGETLGPFISMASREWVIRKARRDAKRLQVSMESRIHLMCRQGVLLEV